MGRPTRVAEELGRRIAREGLENVIFASLR